MRIKENGNKKGRFEKQESVFILIAVILIVVIFSVFFFIHSVNEEKERYAYLAESKAEHTASVIDRVMARANTLTVLVIDHNGDTSFFKSAAKNIYDSVKAETGIALKNVGIAPGGVISDVYPLEGNENLIGFNMLDTEREGNAEAVRARDTGKTVLTNPFELVQGGIGMAGRAPVFLDTENGRQFWGLVTVTIDFDNLIKELRLNDLKEIGADYELSYIDGDGAGHIMATSGNIRADAVKKIFSVRDLTWELSLSPSGGWVPVWIIIMSVFVVFVLCGLAIAFTVLVFRLRERGDMLLHISQTDRLTGCYNRTAYEDALREYGKKGQKSNFVYVSVDINGLKKVNDTLGHAAGDELLCGAVECLQRSLGVYGDIYRIGGDEFAALLSADGETVRKATETLNAEVDGWSGRVVDKLSVSVGYVCQSEFPDYEIAALAKKADECMYESKLEYYSKSKNNRRKSL